MFRHIRALLCAILLCVAVSACSKPEDGLIESSMSDSSQSSQTYSTELTLEGQKETVLYTVEKSASYPYSIGVDLTLFVFEHSDEDDIDVIAYRSTGLDSDRNAKMSIFFQPFEEGTQESDYLDLAAQMLMSIDYTVGEPEAVTVGKGEYSAQRISGSDGQRNQEFYSISHGEESVIVNLTYPLEGAEGVAERMRHMLTTLEIDE